MVAKVSIRVIASREVDINLLRSCLSGTSVFDRPGPALGAHFCEIQDPRKGTRIFLSTGLLRSKGVVVSGFNLEMKLGDSRYEYQNDQHQFVNVTPPPIKKVVYHIDPQGGFVDFCFDEDASEETFGPGFKRRIRLFGGSFSVWL